LAEEFRRRVSRQSFLAGRNELPVTGRDNPLTLRN